MRLMGSAWYNFEAIFFYIAQQEKRKEGNESGQNDVVERKMKEVRLRNGPYVTCKCSRREGAK